MRISDWSSDVCSSDLPADQHAIVQGLKWCRRLFASDALAAFRGPETLPGADIRTDDELLAFARAKGATVYHAVSTCRMGTANDAAVDPDLRVRVLVGLRLVVTFVLTTMVQHTHTTAPIKISTE